MIYYITIFMFLGLICTLYIDKYNQELKKKGICANKIGPFKIGGKYIPSREVYRPCEGLDINTNKEIDTKSNLNEL